MIYNVPEDENSFSALRFRLSEAGVTMTVGEAVSISECGLINELSELRDVLFAPGVKYLLRESTKPLGLFSKLLEGSKRIDSGITCDVTLSASFFTSTSFFSSSALEAETEYWLSFPKK